MTASIAEAERPSVYRAVIVPHRSLGRKGFVVLMWVLIVINAVVGLVFLASGAWPVLAFCGVDVIAVWLAFKINYRAGGAHEVIEITDRELTLTRTDAEGRSGQASFNPYWVQIGFAERRGGRTLIWLQSHGRRVPFGGALTDAERRDLAQALEGELRARRHRAAR